MKPTNTATVGPDVFRLVPVLPSGFVLSPFYKKSLNMQCFEFMGKPSAVTNVSNCQQLNHGLSQKGINEPHRCPGWHNSEMLNAAPSTGRCSWTTGVSDLWCNTNTCLCVLTHCGVVIHIFLGTFLTLTMWRIFRAISHNLHVYIELPAVFSFFFFFLLRNTRQNSSCAVSYRRK